MNLVNLTPHVVNILDAEKKLILSVPPSGTVARLIEKQEHVGQIVWQCGNIPLYRKYYTPQDLPARIEDTLYIVSQLVKSHNPGRTDLVCPGTLVTDDTTDEHGNIVKGKPIGCIGLCF